MRGYKLKKLNFGCGKERKPGFYNVDVIKAKGIHKSFDFDKFPYPLKDNQFEYVLAKQVLEHLLYPKRVFEEFWRICKNGAIIEVQVPYANSMSAFFALDHIHHFNKWTFTSLVGKGFYGRDGHKGERFRLIKQKVTPQKYLRWLPSFILNILSTFLNNIYVQIDVKIQVIKDTNLYKN